MFSKENIRRIYLRERYLPRVVSILTNDFYIIRRRLYQAVLSKKHYMTGSVLDFGCGKKPYMSLFSFDEYIGLDLEQSGHDHQDEEIDVFYDGQTIPFDECRFDSVFSSEVLEHVFNPEEMLREMCRVLKPGGHLLMTVPFAFCEHEMPYDYGRYTSAGLGSLLKKSGFEVISVEKTSNFIEAVFQTWICYIVLRLTWLPNYLRLLVNPFLIAPFSISGVLFGMLFPRDYSYFLNLVVVAKKKGQQTVLK